MFDIPYLADVLWIAPVGAHLYMIWIMSKRNLISSHRLFVAYCFLQAVRLITMYPLFNGHYRWAYFYSFWSYEAIDVILSIAIIREIYVRLFLPYEGIRKLGCALFNWAMAVLLLVACYAALVAQVPAKYLLSRSVNAFDQGATILRAGLILLLICIGLFFQVKWSRLNLGIAIGFFVFFMMNLAALGILVQYGFAAATIAGRLRSAGYNVGAIIWAWYFVRQPVEELRTIAFTNSDLARWNAELVEMSR